MGVCNACRRFYILAPRIGFTKCNVVIYGIIKQNRFLVNNAIRLRNESAVISFISFPSTVTLPSLGSINRGTRSIMVDLPPPDGPTSATVLPLGTVKFMFDNTVLSWYANDTFSKQSASLNSVTVIAFGASVTKGFSSTRLNTRSPAAMPWCILLKESDIAFAGRITCENKAIKVKNSGGDNGD
jgi:hypothetical protein